MKNLRKLSMIVITVLFGSIMISCAENDELEQMKIELDSYEYQDNASGDKEKSNRPTGG
ncbi:MAG: hypothetical protein ACI8QD_002642 [Cyclobacteriaceae bacterium]|jgi:hypothetical protein